MHTTAEPRLRRRVACEFTVARSPGRGLILNLSRSGLFLQTSVPGQGGDEVRVHLATDPRRDLISLDTRVVWKRVASAALRSVIPGGMGLRIEAAPESWYEFLSDAFGADAAATALPRFRVRIKRSGGPRSRTVVLRCASVLVERGKTLAIRPRRRY